MSEINTNNDEPIVDISKVIRFLLMQSKLILLVTAVFFTTSVIFYLSSDKEYRINSLIVIEDSDSAALDPTNTLNLQNNVASTDSNNFMKIFKSRTNITKLIDTLNLNIKTEYDDIELNINQADAAREFTAEYRVETSSNSYNVFKGEELLLQEANYDKDYSFDNLSFKLKASANKHKSFNIEYSSPELIYKDFQNKINVNVLQSANSFLADETLVEVSLVTKDIEKGKTIINKANEIYLDYRVNVETERARAAIRFLDDNISKLKEIVSKNKEDLQTFRKENKSIDVDLEIQAVLDKIRYLESALYDVEIEIANASEIYTKSNPNFTNLLNRKNVLVKQRQEIFDQIESLPNEQQKYIDLYNNVEISQSLYEQLESRRLGFSILEASSTGNLRIIDEAYKDVQVSPVVSSIVFFTFFGFCFICLIAIIRGYRFLPISNPAQLADNGIHEPIIGVVPLVEDEDFNEIKARNSFESLFVNVQSLMKEKPDTKRILITSATPSNGKSTVSRELAKKMSALGYKTLLMDLDLKRGRQHEYFNKTTLKIADYNELNSNNLDKLRIKDNLYFLPRISKLDDTFQFVLSENFRELNKVIDEHFDYVVIDTAPILSVSDTLSIISEEDINLIIVRHSYTKSNELLQTKTMFSQIGAAIDGFIYNAYERPKSYYGYYSLYGNYNYQYYAEKYLDDTYDYKK